MIKFLLDSGDPNEYREIARLAKEHGEELWGATTNPTLIAKKLAGQRISQQEAFSLQKQIVMEILDIVPGAVSAEVYADDKTTAVQMIGQGKEIAAWNKRVYVKLPTTSEGFKARTQLRKEKIAINNTLVFSQQQIFAICLHERIIQKNYGPVKNNWPSFISPFVGRLDDGGENGMKLIENGMKIKKLVDAPVWMLSASIRKLEHIAQSIKDGAEIITAPAKTYREWFKLDTHQQAGLDSRTYSAGLKNLPFWQPPQELLEMNTIAAFMKALETKKLNIEHPLTTTGIARFTQDWKAILTQN